MRFIVVLLFSCLFAQELEVGGDLKAISKHVTKRCNGCWLSFCYMECKQCGKRYVFFEDDCR